MITPIFIFPILTLLFLIISIFLLVFWLLMLIDAIRRTFENESQKIVWIIVIIFLHFLGAILYYFLVKRKATAQTEASQLPAASGKKSLAGWIIALIVIIFVALIVALPAIIVTHNFKSASKKSDDARKIADLQQIKLSLEMKFDKEKSYPIQNNWTLVSSIPNLSVFKGNYYYCSDKEGKSYRLATRIEGNLPQGYKYPEGVIKGCEYYLLPKDGKAIRLYILSN